MADTITDGRTNVDVADLITNWVPPVPGGGASVALDDEIFIQGVGSIAEQITTTRRGALFNAGTAQDWSDQVFYFWVQCGIVGLLETKANSGFTIRFTGPAVTDFFEFKVGGNDSWPTTSSEGGWVQFVVDIENTTRTTGGTPPLTSAIQHVGYTAITTSVMTKSSDNTWIDQIQRLPDGSPGIIIQGRESGTTPWTSADIVTELGPAAGMFRNAAGGGYSINAPIRWGANDSVTHEFEDTNVLWLWEEQEFIGSDHYGLDALGNSGGTTNITFGVKTGAGDDASGAQGVVIAAASTGVRWSMDFNDADLDLVAFYGCQLQHGLDFLLDDPAVSFISTFFIDCDSALVSNAEILRCSVIDANTADGVAFMTTDDLSDIVFCTFEISMGFAVELTTPQDLTQTDKGNNYVGYGPDGVDNNGFPFDTETDVNGSTEVITQTSHPWATGDPVLYNDEGGSETIGLTDGQIYWARDLTSSTISLHNSEADANSDTARLDLTASGGGSGETHTLYSGEAAIKNDTGAAGNPVVISVTSGGSGITIANGIAADTDVNADVEVTFDKLKDNSEVRIFLTGTNVEVDGIEDATDGSTDNRNFAWTAAASLVVDYVIHNYQAGVVVYETIRVNGFIVPTSDTVFDQQQRVDRNVPIEG